MEPQDLKRVDMQLQKQKPQEVEQN
ncbi:Protein of unknown function [Lactobacillus delbrueckii subsp. lactis]|nr:Protein of unknown function [Lactobacillus delbrueckii subsp. lactis]